MLFNTTKLYDFEISLNKLSLSKHMRMIVDRHQTFVESANWSKKKKRIEADPMSIADSGFYYLGDGS